MSDELVFYTHPMSRARIVRWMLEEVGEPYETKILEFGHSMKAPDYLAINPMGKVPAIRHGDTVVTEAAAICAYLADAFPEAGLAPPPTSRERGPYYRWLFFAAGPLEPAVTDKALGFEIPSGPGGDGRLRQSRADPGGAGGRALPHRVHRRRPFHRRRRLCRLAASAGAWRSAKVDRRPAFERYWALISGRPAAIRARDMDDELVEERKKAS